MQLLDGKIASAHYKTEIKNQVNLILSKGKRAPHLAAILVGENAASKAYVASKVKTCAELGFESTLITYENSVSQQELLDKIKFLNDDKNIDGILVQLPLPKHIDENKVIEAIHYNKDVDGFHPVNLGKMMLGLQSFVPATPNGIMLLLKYYQIKTEGLNCVVIGRSNIVGTPMSILLSRNSEPGNCTVTLCHSKTKNMKEICKNADIIVAAIGKPHFVTSDMVKEGAIIIDVGINRIEAPETKSGTRLVGDVDFDQVAPKCSFITPVPGGVGLMTIVSLMKNTLLARALNN
ncbi:MAG TPA: tetrahydrofolate dehydrogenase/cyclohydrolase catalytic domain-containing protein [Chitinophagaceae bacterium]|nr:MAG: methenyltetrahydrofolate cyclohydrolase [Bacteroidetes bacterium OLB11]HMN33687.1 tetrahydrofolate dehydrogenase/cyclohydrolase catalytic domain-containing protein [Chitinophagaceae bacterium]